MQGVVLTLEVQVLLLGLDVFVEVYLFVLSMRAFDGFKTCFEG